MGLFVALALLLQDDDRALAKECLDKPTPELKAKLKARAPESPLAAAYLTVLARAQGDDLKAFQRYVERLPGEFNVDAHVKVIGDCLQEKPELETPALLALAHFDALVRLGAEAKLLEVLAAKLKLSKIDGKWATFEGAKLLELRKNPDADPGSSWGARYVKACLAISAALKNKELIEGLHKALASLKAGSPAHLEALASNVKPFIPCRRCKGQPKKTCDLCEGKGERTATCSQCTGSGQIYKGKSGRTGQDIIEPCSACKGKGKWSVKCTACDGGTVTCAACKGAEWKAPTMADFASEEKCGACGGSGFAFARARHPCWFCKGLGSFLKPKGAEAKLVGPTD